MLVWGTHNIPDYIHGLRLREAHGPETKADLEESGRRPQIIRPRIWRECSVRSASRLVEVVIIHSASGQGRENGAETLRPYED